VKASCSMFSQILKLIPRTDFERIVKETGLCDPFSVILCTADHDAWGYGLRVR
jgi:hypothetical protein